LLGAPLSKLLEVASCVVIIPWSQHLCRGVGKKDCTYRPPWSDTPCAGSWWKRNCLMCEDVCLAGTLAFIAVL
jgi:hypothetical protein